MTPHFLLHGFLLLVSLALPQLALARATSPQQAHVPVVAVVYADDELSPGQFAAIIEGMQLRVPIQVMPVRLAFEPMLAAATATSASSSAYRQNTLGRMLALAGNDGQIAVVYPDIGDPYRGIFTKIIEGIEARAKKQVLSLAVGGDQSPSELRQTLKNKDIRVVIALGRQGMQAADGLGDEFGVVVGGVTAVSEEKAERFSVISLSPDPALLFARLKAITPKVRRIHVVYDPGQNSWLLRLARNAARAQGIELLVYEATTLKRAVGYYQQILAEADVEHDALWLPQDSTTVEESVVLPMVLQGAWTSGLPVFSSSFAHVKRGVLFSLFPDNAGLGQHLASSALDYLAPGSTPSQGISPLKDVLGAINLRTARHLGLNLSSQLQRSFSVVFADQ